MASHHPQPDSPLSHRSHKASSPAQPLYTHGLPTPITTHSYFTANKDYFDQQAQSSTSESSSAIELARRQSITFLKAYPFDEDTTTVMDFACGSGLISRQLIPHARSVLGVDISQGMVDNYNKRVEFQGISPREMRAVCVELTGQSGDLGGATFDVIVCASAYHHFEDIDEMTRILSCYLKPQGKLLVCDILKRDDDTAFMDVFASHAVDSVVTHCGGISEEDIRKAFDAAGLSLVLDSNCCTARKGKVKIDFFLAVGTKA